MQSYILPYPEELNKVIEEQNQEISSLINERNFLEAEKLLAQQFELIRSNENKLPEGKRYHKGATLYNWGIFMPLQNEPKKISEGYRNILLAFIEDLLDSDKMQEAHGSPSYKMLLENPFMTRDLLNLVENNVQERRTFHSIPKNPEDVLQPLSNEAKEAVEKPIEITIEQVRPIIESHLMDKPKEKRVFVGGNYRIIALLKEIYKTVKD